MDSKRLGKRIKAFRKLKGYTQITFAKEIGVSVAVLGNVERGTKTADDELVEKIIDTLAVPREELLLEHASNVSE